MQPVRLIIVGAGSRGSSFAPFALNHPELAQVVGVAEPHPFMTAVGTGDTSHILSGTEEALETHLTVFAAEQSRREGRTVAVTVAAP